MSELIKGGVMPPKPSALTEASLDRLVDIIDIEIPGFLKYLEHAVFDVRTIQVINDQKKPPKQMRAELDRAYRALSDLSPFAKRHVYEKLNDLDEDADGGAAMFASVRTALNSNYNYQTHPARTVLIKHLIHIDQHFILNQDGKDTRRQLKGIVEFMIDATGVKAGVVSAVDDVRKKSVLT